MYALIALAILFGTGCWQTSKPKTADERTPAAFGLDLLRTHQDLNWTKFRSLLLTQRADTVERALGYLASNFTAYLRFHTLMYDSLSIQKATFTEPRAIVFGPEARFVFTFNRDDALETMEYDASERKFLFREVAFKTKGFDRDALDLAPNEIALETKELVISTPNPRKCLQCHGANANPIWLSYFLWTGAYGSNDDLLSISFDSNSWNSNNSRFFARGQASSQGRLMALRPGAQDAELEEFARYARLKPRQPHYHWLPTRFHEEAAIRYVDGASFKSVDSAKRAYAEYLEAGEKYEWPSHPNSFLLTALQNLNADRLLARLRTARLENAYGDLLWRQLDGDLADQRPDRLIPQMARRIQRVLATHKFRGVRPNLRTIKNALRSNLIEEMGMQRERIYRHDLNLGGGVLTLIGSEGNQRNGRDGAGFDRDPLLQIKDSISFYSYLLNVKDVGELDRIAFGIETDDQFRITTLDLLLRDHGIDLHDYTLNLRQLGLTFHTSGLDSAMAYLGVVQPKSRP